MWQTARQDAQAVRTRGLVVQEWTASATRRQPLSRGELVAEPSGKRIEWDGMDVIPSSAASQAQGRLLRLVSILRQVGLL